MTAPVYIWWKRKYSTVTLQKAGRGAWFLAILGPFYLDIQANLTEPDDHQQRGHARIGWTNLGNVAVEY